MSIEPPTEEPRRLSHRPRDDEDEENICRGCGYPIAEGCEYCGECLCEEDEL